MELVDAIGTIEANAKSAAEIADDSLDRNLHAFRILAVTMLGAYLVTAFALGHWALKSIAAPLQQLTASAHSAMSEGVPFHLGNNGPKEVRILGDTIHKFIAQLEDRVDCRTAELKQKTHDLHDQIADTIAAEEENATGKERCRPRQCREE